MSDWQQLIKTVAPLVGTALGGPFGGVAASFIADKLGLEGKTVDAVTRALSDGKMTPEQISQIKLAELDMKKFMADHSLRTEQLAVENQKSARDMFTSTRAKTPAILTYLITLGFFGVLGAMFKWPEIKESAPLMIMLGSLGTAWTGACAFWFGTTHGSQSKNDMLANSQPVK